METRTPNKALSLSRAGAWAIHLYTASGILWGLLALEAVFDKRLADAYLWMAIAVFVDASDGPLARRFRVAEVLPEIDGCLLDNIVDYLTWTFVPVILLWQSSWLTEPTWLWCTFALLGSAFAFVHRDAKVTEAGFFRGFPSYWNVFAFYVDVSYRTLGPAWDGYGPYVVSGLTACFALLSVAPVYFVYPNRMEHHRWFFIGGGCAWGIVCIAVIACYPNIPLWLFCLSLVYPVLYLAFSFILSARMGVGRAKA